MKYYHSILSGFLLISSVLCFPQTGEEIAVKTLECGTHLPIDEMKQEEIHVAQVLTSLCK